LGESKASELRGESMQDVIFSGSGTRKPAGRASVELVFENNEGRITGAWGQYSEISVKRVLTRDGQSTYWINNQAVRRKDVYDLFMGTGLGPRAYAIIGQGMISRVIESRPEELRVFLEEAAGVSKYRERRKETEGRLSDTRENLARIEDIRLELEGQLDKLAHQAEVAQRYTEISSKRDEKQRWLWWTRREESVSGLRKLDERRNELVLQSDAQTAALRSTERELEETRQLYHNASDEVHDAQTALYETNTEITRVEAEQRRLTENRERAVLSKEQALSVIDHETSVQAQGEQQRIADAEAASLEDIAIAEQRQNLETLRSTMEPLEKALASRNDSFASAQADVATAQAELRALNERQNDLQSRSANLKNRIETLQRERQSIERVDPSAKSLITNQRQEALRVAEQSAAQLAAAEAEIDQALSARDSAQQELQQHRASLTHAQAQLEALQSLQAQIDAKDQLKPWLTRQGMDQKPRLWDQIQVKEAWRVAVEAVLADRIGAVELPSITQAAGFANDLPPARLALYTTTPAGAHAPGAGSLAAQIAGESAIAQVVRGWLNHVQCAEDLNQAIRQSEAAADDRAVWVTREGHLISRGLVRFYAAEDLSAGVLERRSRIEQLGVELKAHQLVVEEAVLTVQRAESHLMQKRQALNDLRERAKAAQARAHELEVAELRLDEKIQRLTNQDNVLETSLSALSDELNGIAQQIDQCAQSFEQAKARLDSQQQEMDQQRETLESQTLHVQQARESVAAAERSLQELTMAKRLREEQVRAFEEGLRQSAQRLTEAQSRLAQAETQLKEIQTALDSSELQPLLDQRISREAAVAEVRERADQLSQKLRALDEQRITAERALEPLRAALTQVEIDASGLRAGVAQIEEQILDAGLNIESLTEQLHAAFPDERYPKPSSLHAEVQRLSKEIDAMGPVNLAALSELEQSKERKQFLDSQAADLVSAVETLEDAIRKIDRETRSLLQDTFNTVNLNFGQLFPKLFGGGEAKLVMTGEEILDCGVQVMAQPPGKRNTSIHLLSGGEKALTATALVFALFQLNPAPFCMLDEVDAPLDDPNTERFCNLVRHMSSSTQFIFITHNKIAMEMGQHLMGVTMQEQGVSRIVAVDLDAANTMVQEAA